MMDRPELPIRRSRLPERPMTGQQTNLNFGRGAKTVGEVLATIRTDSRDESEKGRWFENLTMRVLTEMREYEITEIHRWTDWPERRELTGRSGRDIGIDLVGRRNDGKWVAIQCKFYAEGRRIGKPEIDSFLAATQQRLAGTQRPVFAMRWIVATTSWTRNAEDQLKGTAVPPLRRINFLRHERESIAIDQIERPVQQPWPLQEDAIRDVVRGLSNFPRGRLVMACGTGKTFTSLCIAENFVPDGGRILFLAPSIALVSQARREWLRHTIRPLDCRVICSDSSAGGRGESPNISLSGLECPVSSDPQELAGVLSADTSKTRVLFCTYQSLTHVASAQFEHEAPPFDLAVMDEAHRTTGVDRMESGLGSETGFRIVHHDDRLNAEKRLYMTATPRIYSMRSKSLLAGAGLKTVDMSDDDVYGPEFHRLSFAAAVNAGILSDYRVIVLGVHENAATPGLRDRLIRLGDSQKGAKPLIVRERDIARVLGTSLAVHGASEGKAEDRPGRLLKTIAFANSIARSKFFAEALAHGNVRSATTRRLRRSDKLAASARIETRHLDAGDSAMERSLALRTLAAASEGGPARLLCNVGLFGEGVDVPSLDAVVFMEPRESQVDVVQAVGRVMRKAEGKRFGYIVVPVVIPPGQDVLSALERGGDGYEALGRVLRALQSHDGRLAEAPLRFVKVHETSRPGSGGGDSEVLPEQGVLDLKHVSDGVYAHVVAASGLGKPGLQVSGEITSIVRSTARMFEEGELDAVLANVLGLPSARDSKTKSACTIAALLVVNACLLHRRLYGLESMNWLPSLGSVCGSKNPKGTISSAWTSILDRDYGPVFEPALAVLETLPDRPFVARALRLMAECANRVADSLSELGYDHAGPLYHRILPTAKSDGAFYTNNISALMLARLALGKGFTNWADSTALSDLRIMDPACGTGTLLMAVLRTIKDRVRAARDTDEDGLEELHRLLVEDVLCGLDINRHGIQLAACNLTLGAPTVDYRRMNLMTLKHGPQPTGGVRTGSLELLGTAEDQRDSVRNLIRPMASMSGLDAEQVNKSRGAEFPLKGLDAVIMNPPFTDNVKRNRQYSAETVKSMQQREIWLRNDLGHSDPEAASVINSNSIRTYFTPLADRLLHKANGHLAIVLPVTGCTSASGLRERKFLAKRFHVEQVVVSHDPKRINFSENTGIHECLLIARRMPNTHKNRPPSPSVYTPTLCPSARCRPRQRKQSRLVTSSSQARPLHGEARFAGPPIG